MHITLDQAQAFDAVARLGTVQKAAKSLFKGHSAILYLLRSMEEQLGLRLFDRTGYRNRISAEGEVVLKYCRQLIQTRNELSMACESLKGGWEPSVRVIYDGVVDFNVITDALFRVNWVSFPTEIKMSAAFLREVENKFVEENADLMFTILPIQLPGVRSLPLKSIEMLLVAQNNHPLAKFTGRRKAHLEDISQYAYVKVRDTSGELGLSTEKGIYKSTIQVNDFPTKKEAIMRGLGFGWLPKYMIERELQNGKLQIIHTDLENRTTFQPKLYHRRPELLGQAVKRLVDFFQKT